MAVPYEDTIQGGTDISGDPPPIAPRSPAQVTGDVNRTVHRTGGGQQESDPGTDQQPTPKPEQKQGGQQASDPNVDASAQMPDQGVAWRPNPAVPAPPPMIDWKQKVQKDPQNTYFWQRYVTTQLAAVPGPWRLNWGAAAQVLKEQGLPLIPEAIQHVEAVWNAAVDTKALAASVHNIWGQDNAQGAIFRGFAEAHGLDEQRAAWVAANVLPATANPLNAVGMSGELSWAARFAAFAGPGMLDALGSANPNDRASAMLWSAFIGGIFSGLPVPAALKKAIADGVKESAPVRSVVDHVGALGSIQRQVRQFMTNPDVSKTDWIDKVLSAGEIQESEKILAKAPKVPFAGFTKTGEEFRDAEGNIIRRAVPEAKKELESALRKVGVSSRDQLEEMAMRNELTPNQLKAVRANWGKLGYTYDLKRWVPGEAALRNPVAQAEAIAQAEGDKGVAAANDHLSDLTGILAHLYGGVQSTHPNPLVGTWRSLLGVHRTSDVLGKQWLTSMVNLTKDTGVHPNDFFRAAEGDAKVYEAMPPRAKLAVDSYRLVVAAARGAGQETEAGKRVVANFVPRVAKTATTRGKGAAAVSRAVVGTPGAHRAEALLFGKPEEEGAALYAGQKYDSVFDANADMKRTRDNLVKLWTDPVAEGWPKNAKWSSDTRIQPGMAAEDAKKIAAEYYPDFETNFFKAVERGLLPQLKQIHSQQAIDAWSHMVMGDGQKAAVRVENSRQAMSLREQGYESPDARALAGWMVHPELNSLLKRATTRTSGMLTSDASGALWKRALQLESKAIGAIMFFPTVHLVNVAGRAAILAASDPIGFFHYVAQGKALLPGQRDEVSRALRTEAWRNGVLPPQQGKSYLNMVDTNLGDALGDFMDSPVADVAPRGDLRKVIDIGRQWKQQASDLMWGRISDFGVMAYHLEKNAALAHGVDEAVAREYAGRRANTWMGHVLPEDTNPHMHDLARLAMFAPNWWRTWAELMVPVYRRTGFAATDLGARHLALQQSKVLMAMFAAQKLSGGALNLMMSGHLQQDNQPGSQDKVEITRPEMIRFLQSVHYPGADKIDPETGMDPATGARLTMENPLGRFQRDVEEATGFQSGHPGWEGSDVWTGTEKFLAARMSPILDATATGFNVDLYRTAAAGDGVIRKVDPNSPVGQPSFWNAAYAFAQVLPGGGDMTYGLQQMQRDAAAQGGAAPTDAAKKVLGGVPGLADRFVLNWLMGVNGPYATAERTRGTTATDKQYEDSAMYTKQHDQRMQEWSAQALSGQMTPEQWLQKYRDEQKTYSGQMDAIWHGTSEYLHGTKGMVNEWNALYSAPGVVAADGTINQDALEAAQNEFRAKYTKAELDDMDAALTKNDKTYPMLGLYHKVTDAYYQWQSDWAQKKGIDKTALHQQISEYGKLYGQGNAQARYLQTHPELRAYEQAKSTEWYRSPMGLMYGLFYGSPAVTSYMAQHHLTPAQVEQQAGLPT